MAPISVEVSSHAVNEPCTRPAQDVGVVELGQGKWGALAYLGPFATDQQWGRFVHDGYSDARVVRTRARAAAR